MLWNPKKIAKEAKKNFEEAWIKTAELLPECKDVSSRYTAKKGRTHALFETVQRLRQAYLELGFDEVVNPLFIEDKEVKRQFGKEALAVLDRCYYLAGLPRPDVGLSQEKIEKIKSYGVDFDPDKVQELLHGYKKGRVSGDDLIMELASVLNTDSATATRIFSEVFPEFKELKPEAGTLTLRSHMTSGWFLTLSALYGKKELPVKLFSIDRCFRREQQEDATHLRSHFSASCVVMAEDACIEDGKTVAKLLLEKFGFTDFKFKPDEKRSKYYAPGTQTEVYAYSKKTGWVEVATFGMYSPVALSQYKIPVPVMNLGLGVERLAMLLYGESDVRELVYPQFYKKWELSDEEIAQMIYYKAQPETEEGKKLALLIEKTALEKAEEEAPVEVLVYSGDFLNKKISIKLVEKESGKKLLGPAYKNRIFVKDGSIIGGEAIPDAYDTGITYIKACSLAIARKAEEITSGKAKVRFGMIKSLGDINLRLSQVARRYITTYEKKIDVRGPLFLTAEIEVSR